MLASTDRRRARLLAWRDRTFRPQPAVRYMHPGSVGADNAGADHDANLDRFEESSPNYLQWIADACTPYLGDRVLEVGAGNGSVALRYSPGRTVVLVDRSPWCASEMHEKFDEVPNVTVRQGDVADIVDDGERFSSVLMINVLEHIPDDVGTLASMSRLLEPSGRIVVYVPALNGLFTPWDHKVGHCRRYAPWRMREVFAAAGLETVEMRYMNMLSIPPWWLFSRSTASMGSAGGVSLWDRTGVRLTRGIERHVHVPVGLNLLAVGRLPG